MCVREMSVFVHTLLADLKGFKFNTKKYIQIQPLQNFCSNSGVLLPLYTHSYLQFVLI